MFNKASFSTSSRIAEKQMRNRELARTQHPEAPPHETVRVQDFVAISQSVGCGGQVIARALGERLHWPVFDRELLSAMGKGSSLRCTVYGSLDERDPGLLEETCRSLLDDGYQRNDYLHRLRETVWAIARSSPAILVGRAADLILPRDHGLRVRFSASREYCIQHVAEEKRLSRADALAEIEMLERERDRWLRNHFRIDAEDPVRYDLCLNIERFTIDQAVGLLLAALTMRVRPAV